MKYERVEVKIKILQVDKVLLLLILTLMVAVNRVGGVEVASPDLEVAGSRGEIVRVRWMCSRGRCRRKEQIRIIKITRVIIEIEIEKEVDHKYENTISIKRWKPLKDNPNESGF